MINNKPICPVCGAPITRKGRTFCCRACYNTARQHTRKCAVCGVAFPCSPSSYNVTCSLACSKLHRATMESTVSNAVIMAKARRTSPILQPDEHHINAKSWVIRAPDGQVYRCRNLKHWLRNHSDMLDGTVSQAWDGITKIKYSMQGKRKNPSRTWKGWTLQEYGDS